MTDVELVIHALGCERSFRSKYDEYVDGEYEPGGFKGTSKILGELELLLYSYQDALQQLQDRGYLGSDCYTDEMNAAMEDRCSN